MKKKHGAPMTREAFRTRFLAVLRDYSADVIVARILNSPDLRELAAWVLWHTVNDTAAALAAMSKKQISDLQTRLPGAIRGFEDAEWIYMEIVPKPHLAEYLSTLRSDMVLMLENVTRAAPMLTQKRLGRDRDFLLVWYAKTQIEGHLHQPITYPVLADLLNAADAAGETRRNPLSAEAVRLGLQRFSERRFDLLKPALERWLAQQYPRASDLPAA